MHSPSTNSQIESAVSILKRGGVVVFPTETAYGLAADATNPRAVARIRLIKHRPQEKTMPIIASSFSMAEKYVRLSPLLRSLAGKYWPGPLVIVAPAKAKKRKNKVALSKLHPDVVRGDGTAAIRVSSHPVAAALSRRLKRPIVATSANLAGEKPTYSVQETLKQFKGRKYQPDFIIDIGPIPKRLPSTIIEEKNGKIVTLRQGAIKIPRRYV